MKRKQFSEEQVTSIPNVRLAPESGHWADMIGKGRG